MNRNALRKVAKDLGLGQTNQKAEGLPVQEFESIAQELNQLPRKGRSLSHEGKQMVARAVIQRSRLSCVSIVCVSLYQKNKRWPRQGNRFVLTPKEIEMFKRAEKLRDVCAQAGVGMKWRLVLADAWSTMLFPEQVDPTVNDTYCQLMDSECHRRGFQAVRWTTLMQENGKLWEEALTRARSVITEQMVCREANLGETRFDTHKNREHALELARLHIKWRSAEGLVFTTLWGPQLGLSTESHSLRKWDNLFIPTSAYPWHDYMPKYPHWL